MCGLRACSLITSMRKFVALISGLVLGLSSAQAIVKDSGVHIPPKSSSKKTTKAVMKSPTPIIQTQTGSTYNIAFQSVNLDRLTQAERTILGRTFEHQDVDIRLNRLERSVFNRINPGLTYNQRINNLITNAGSNSTIGIASNHLSRLEQRVFNRTFAMDTPRNRIERLEQNMFGAAQSGDLNARYETLNRASGSYQRQQRTVQQMPSSSGWRQNLGNMIMGGMVTGMTPPLTGGMDPYDMDFLDSRGAGGNARYHTGNRGWGYNNRSMGSRTGVTILD